MAVSQTEFTQALLSPNAPWPKGLSDGRGNPAGRRFNVYRNNVMVSLIEALKSSFPVLEKLLGGENFTVLARAFAQTHPPSSPLMMFYGAEMPEFLMGFEPTKNLGYLPDIARLELLLRESYHAPDAAPIAPEALAALDPEQLMARTLGVAPSPRLLRSDWPVHAIWAYNMQPGAPKPVMQAEDVLILRPEFDPEPHLLPAGGGAFIAALLGGQSLGQALEAAPGFDPTQVLALLISSGAIHRLGD